MQARVSKLGVAGAIRSEESYSGRVEFVWQNPGFALACELNKTQQFYSKLFDWQITPAGPAAMIAQEAGGITGHITSLGHEPYHYTIFMWEWMTSHPI
jgi:hypothetical protein